MDASLGTDCVDFRFPSTPFQPVAAPRPPKKDQRVGGSGGSVVSDSCCARLCGGAGRSIHKNARLQG